MNLKKETILACEKECRSLIKKRKWLSALDLISSRYLKGLTVTKSTLKKIYGLKPKQIELLNFIEVENPYYKCSPPMKLYLIGEAEYILNKGKKINAEIIK